MKKLVSLVCLLVMTGATVSLMAQNNVGIGTANPNTNAILELYSKTQGVLVPRMPAANRLAIIGPVDGLMVYDTDSSCFFFFSAATSSWTSLCQTSGGGTTVAAYNTAVIYNNMTDSLSVTDAGGTISAYINPPGRWSKKGITDDSSSAAAFVPMKGTTVTFTPTKSVVFISATAAGDVDPTVSQACGVGVRVKDSVTSNVVIGASCVANSFVVDQNTLSYVGVAAWNVSMSTAYTVTPGVPVTLFLEWAGAWSDGSTHAVRCLANSDPFQLSHRSIIVWE